jgi:fumarylacetoacetase
MAQLNETHDVTRKSWVTSANSPATDFPIQNLPLGIFSNAGCKPRGGVAIGDQIFDVKAALDAGLFIGRAAEAARFAAGGKLNPLMDAGNSFASALRHRVSDLLREGGPDSDKARAAADKLLVPIAQGHLHLPAAVGGFTDFLTSVYHSERGGRHSRPDNPVPPVFRYMPIAYNSRASSVRVSGEAVKRPNGQFKKGNDVRFGPTEAFDFELELGLFVGKGNALGEPVSVDATSDLTFGYCLLNDWSARDIQGWENALGPFLAKSVSTSISPWVVTAEAMAPFHTAAFKRPAGDPAPLPYLFSIDDQARGGLDLDMEVYLSTARMRSEGGKPHRITLTNFKHMYWTFAQMLAHHTSNGCNLRPGDVVASGTVSGPTDDSRACYSEITVRGTTPITLPNGEQRNWLVDGDEITFRARASRSGFASIGFGECKGRIEPAVAWPAKAARGVGAG